ncbi:peptidoglycan D,D-transpeptidase FtsI family protein [Saccharomonospora azurea]|uniref:Cell division protein FtsI/penicillin-binding protein 2 n=1 Tax=Saccharomonospora azurea NA-128 TaxID=882081 RepID=H8G4J7_9PSEU|nr:penicillin-binding protein 2 [Saccharomonospora azurea]EHY88146.1 cell division protein FtsI/penicillin-binding protein 2 [Saccharomonospora azurea NA-128]
MPAQRGTRGVQSGRGPHRTYSVRARRNRSATTVRNNRNRFVAGRIVLTIVLVAAGLKLVHIQAFEASALSERAERQRTTIVDIPAERGSILDRNGAELAFSVETRRLWVNLRQMRLTWEEYAREKPESGENFDTRAAEIADHIAGRVPDLVTEDELLAAFHKDASFTYLVDDVEPSVAEAISEKYPEIGYEKRAKRVYPGEEVAANIVGYANWRTDSEDVSEHNLHGLAGLESYRDDDLVGTPGRQIVDTAQGGDVVIPGTERDMQPATPGSNLELTIDSDVQYELQRSLAAYVEKVEAKGGSAVILDAHTGEVYALANHRTFNPNEPPASADDMGNPAVSTPFEPGSVAKIVTATAAIEAGVAKPETTLAVPGSMRVADHTVHDAWSHATQDFTVTGIFAKSSNVGTLMLADQVGPDRFLSTLKKFGGGQRTGIGLPGESPGYVPPRDQWSGTTYGNLPIGQGLSMTVVQMTSMYQAIANGGVRVEPRVVKAKVTPDGRRIPEPAPESVRVTDAKTADTVKNMLRATTQGGDYAYSGTAPEAALEGYQVSGKTGTGQQVDPETGRYSNRLHNITFAGILPADEPRFVVGIWLDAPDTTIPGGSSAGALYAEIASYLAQRYNIPVSEESGPRVKLVR